jgi:two-component system chemotaxis sensor kinase CheA
MLDRIDRTKNNLETIALEVVTLDANDIPALGNILNYLGQMEGDSPAIDQPIFQQLLQAIKGYIEKLILGETADVTPLEDGIDSLQTIYRHVSDQQEYKGDTSYVLEKLGFKKAESENKEKEPEIEPEAEIEEEEKECTKSAGEDLSEEDREILSDFVMESLESIETDEVSLMDLEQDPGDLNSINAIFRSFHTIKGVSALLNLDRINRLAHRAENLLDKARSGEIGIQATVIDIILESVDALKN